MAGSRFGRSMRDARKTVVGGFFGKSVFGDDCPICFMTFEPEDKVEIFGCHHTHMLHEGCYRMFIETNEKNGVNSYCPMCRAPVDKSKTTRKLLNKAEEKEPEDPFYRNQDVVVGPPQGVPVQNVSEPGSVNHSNLEMGMLIVSAPDAHIEMPQVSAPEEYNQN